MILVLDHEVTNPNVGMVELPNVNTTLTEDDLLTVIGFGTTSEGGVPSHTLKEVDVEYVGHEACSDIYSYSFDSDIMFCAGGRPEGGTDSCQ